MSTNYKKGWVEGPSPTPNNQIQKVPDSTTKLVRELLYLLDEYPDKEDYKRLIEKICELTGKEKSEFNSALLNTVQVAEFNNDGFDPIELAPPFPPDLLTNKLSN